MASPVLLPSATAWKTPGNGDTKLSLLTAFKDCFCYARERSQPLLPAPEEDGDEGEMRQT